MKIFELAKELGVENKELLAKAKELGVKAASHLSAITDDEVKKLKAEYKGKAKKADKEEKEDKKSDIKTTGNVIIRRQVIVNEEKKPVKPVRNPKEDIGFNSQRNTNYNIVYREKPTKPMSVSELFGLAPKKPVKKAEPKVNKEEVKETKVVKTEATEIKKVEAVKTEKPVSTTNTKPMNTHGFNKDAKKPIQNQGNKFNKPANNAGKPNFNKGPRIEKDIEKTEIVEKESGRYSSKLIDKQKANRNLDENKKKKSRRGGEEEFNSGKLRDLKSVDRLSNMFEDQEGGMLDYYDLSKGGRRKKEKKQEKVSKQKIFELWLQLIKH